MPVDPGTGTPSPNPPAPQVHPLVGTWELTRVEQTASNPNFTETSVITPGNPAWEDARTTYNANGTFIEINRESSFTGTWSTMANRLYVTYDDGVDIGDFLEYLTFSITNTTLRIVSTVDILDMTITIVMYATRV